MQILSLYDWVYSYNFMFFKKCSFFSHFIILNGILLAIAPLKLSLKPQEGQNLLSHTQEVITHSGWEEMTRIAWRAAERTMGWSGGCCPVWRGGPLTSSNNCCHLELCLSFWFTREDRNLVSCKMSSEFPRTH